MENKTEYSFEFQQNPNHESKCLQEFQRYSVVKEDGSGRVLMLLEDQGYDRGMVRNEFLWKCLDLKDRTECLIVRNCPRFKPMEVKLTVCADCSE